ncbi:MAG: V-type ATP synthase subunit K [Firmicutes bacterium]|nr:V-type ATP synthase subunit K [Bacillota bacterium]
MEVMLLEASGWATMGNVYALIGAALAVALTGIGSAVGMSWVQQAAAGVVSEQPEKYGKLLVLQLIPSSNALYGFVVGFLIVNNVVLGSGSYGTEEGLMVLALSLPIAIAGMAAGLAQAKVCAAGVRMVGKRVELSGRALVMSVFIELFALFALIVSILGVLQVPML